MRGFCIAFPLSLLLWGGIFWMFSELGFDAFAFLMIAAASLYIFAIIRKDWKPITQGEWADGESVNYGKPDAPK